MSPWRHSSRLLVARSSASSVSKWVKASRRKRSTSLRKSWNKLAVAKVRSFSSKRRARERTPSRIRLSCRISVAAKARRRAQKGRLLYSLDAQESRHDRTRTGRCPSQESRREVEVQPYTAQAFRRSPDG